MEIEIPTRKDRQGLLEFAARLKIVNEETGFKVSARGWAYQLEVLADLPKGDFDKVEKLINWMRKKGYLPIDFTAQDPGRKWDGVEIPTTSSPVEWLGEWLEGALKAYETYTPNWWEGEKYYLQVLVEKIDLKTLFEPITREYHIPISTASGWSDINQRAQMARRFKRAEERGQICVLLYCGDFDPFGVKIGDTLAKNLEDIQEGYYEGGGKLWNPSALIFDRFGLNQEFIEENELSWIENLETSSGLSLADPSHRFHHLPEVQTWLSEIGERKVEANALVVAPEAGRDLCRKAIEAWLGKDALERFKRKRGKIKTEIEKFDETVGVLEVIQEAIDLIEGNS